MTVLRTVLIALVLAWTHASASEPNPRELAARLLQAIQSGDEAALRALANNPRLFDAEGMRYLTGEPTFRFGPRGGRSARTVLRGHRILTRVDIVTDVDGTRIVDVTFLPTRVAASFAALDRKVRAGQARLFDDYIACRLELRGASVRMPHVCFAETDAVD